MESPLELLNDIFEDIGVTFTFSTTGTGTLVFSANKPHLIHFIILPESQILRINQLKATNEIANGNNILSKLIKFAKRLTLQEIRLNDESKFDSGNCKNLNLAAWEFLTKKKSWYNRFNFVSENTSNEKEVIDALLQKKFNDVIRDDRFDDIIDTTDKTIQQVFEELKRDHINKSDSHNFTLKQCSIINSVLKELLNEITYNNQLVLTLRSGGRRRIRTRCKRKRTKCRSSKTK